jgi:xanthine dehydrogenase YagR molybdenum-binding subunit
MNAVGTPLSRVDGPAKVTGSAKYAAEFAAEGLAHGFIVSSPIAKGRIVRIDADDALALPGVLQVFTHKNRPRVARSDAKWRDRVAPPGSPLRPLRDGRIHHAGQPIALVVAESPELAPHAARLLKIRTKTAPHATDLRARLDAADEREWRVGPAPEPRGDAEQALASAVVRVDAEYSQPAEYHNPIEMHAATVVREDDGGLTVYEKTQGVGNTHAWLCNVFGLAEDRVRVRSPFVGGAFGSGLRPQAHLFFAVMAALSLERSVRVVLTRQQMFTFGHRPETIQRVRLGLSADGKLTAILHDAIAETSPYEDYDEAVVEWSGQQYACENARFSHRAVALDRATPCDMRAPGAATGMFALECAMDELAAAAGMDPLELRFRNDTDRNANEDLPFSSRNLRGCLTQAAERFGWARRSHAPRSMREGTELVGWGMATGAWEAMQKAASASATYHPDGLVTVASATADIGTGTYTAMTQIAAEALGVPVERVRFELGDTSLPAAPIEGGSMTVSSVGSAVELACEKLRLSLVDLVARTGESTIGDAMRRAGVTTVIETANSVPDEKRQKRYSMCSHSAVFAEVRVDESLGTIRVTRVVSAVAAGRIINPKTATSQISGGIVWGIGMALEEDTAWDHALGRIMNHDFAGYHVPVNADVRNIDLLFVEERDDVVNPLGVKGVGEIGVVGVAAAIANAVYHATGKRVRSLPITLDKLL